MTNQSPELRWIRVAAADRRRVWLGIPRDEKWKWIIQQRAVIEVTNRLETVFGSVSVVLQPLAKSAVIETQMVIILTKSAAFATATCDRDGVHPVVWMKKRLIHLEKVRNDAIETGADYRCDWPRWSLSFKIST